MSYPPARPSSTPSGEGPGAESHPTPSSSHQGQSPLDWTNFLSFQTPPVTTAGPAGTGMRSSNSGYGVAGGPTHESQSGAGGMGTGMPGSDNGVATNRSRGQVDDQYNFARGISMNPSGAGSMSFQHPYSHQTQQQQQPPQLQRQYSGTGVNGQQASGSGTSRPTTSNGGQHQQPPVNKGKSPANNPPTLHGTDLGEATDHSGNIDNGLTLDPAAFSRDIRFQVPSFLSGHGGGAQTFPPGGEAWSGFSSATFHGDGGMGNSLTPGQLFSNMFTMNSGNGDHSGAQDDGMGSYGAYGNTGWDGGWGGDKSGGLQGTNGMQPGAMGTTFYINPNPSHSVLGQNRAMQNQTGMGGQTQEAQHPPHFGPTSQRPSDASASTHSGRPSISTINMSNPTASPSQMTSMPIPSPQTQYPSADGDPRRRSTIASSTSNNPNSAAGTGSMPTSAILPSFSVDGGAFQFRTDFGDPTKPVTSTINIASSSTAPYAPPSNTQQLLTAPIAPPFSGPSLSDGPGLYSTTGFDMVGVLSRVAARKDPKTVLGPVDLSCSFVVVDVRRYDCPIVYASPTFTALTGYELPQMLGRNCRFLQSPDGEVVKGSKRKYTDNVAVAHLKRMLNAGKECQASLINYRRGGIPFINLVTVVPIPWDGTDIVYHVGFQIDLVEQPNAILRNMRDGSYQVNYTVGNPPQAPLKPPGREPTVTGLSEDVIEIMGSRVNAMNFGQGEDGPKMDWLKMVLENADGLFQFVSPAVRRVLEYDPEDLINRNISDICHPSDIVPLMRELKDSTHAPAEGGTARQVNLVFRIRRKLSGYVWIECTGRLHVEPGKGRKAVILSGRARSVPSLPWELVAAHGGLGETEFWAKLSFHGLILHATSTVNDLIGQTAEDIQGLSFFSYLPGGDNGPPAEGTVDLDPASPVATFASALKQVTSGTVRDGITVSHKMLNRTGGQIDVITILYSPRARPDLPARSESEGAISSSESSESSPSNSASASGGSTIAGIKPSSIVAQIKLVPLSTTSANLSASSANISSHGRARAIAQLTNAKPIAHAESSNVFEELETTRGTSWQYELHQLRLLNRRLKEDVSAARAVAANAGKKAKRRKGDGGDVVGGTGGTVPGGAGTGAGNGGTGNMGPPPAPQLQDQYNAAPRHQLAPGFGLVTQGMPSPYF